MIIQTFLTKESGSGYGFVYGLVDKEQKIKLAAAAAAAERIIVEIQYINALIETITTLTAALQSRCKKSTVDKNVSFWKKQKKSEIPKQRLLNRMKNITA